LLDKEKAKVTKNEKIYINPSPEFDPIKLRRQIKELERLAQIMNESGIAKKMKEIIALGL